MNGDTPFSIYSFELAALQQRRLKRLIRPGTDGNSFGKAILNFGGHRFRVLRCRAVVRPELTAEDISQAGFSKDTSEEERAAAEKWLDDIGADLCLWLYDLEPLKRYSNEPLT